jgi:hypothetical protein
LVEGRAIHRKAARQPKPGEMIDRRRRLDRAAGLAKRGRRITKRAAARPARGDAAR